MINEYAEDILKYIVQERDGKTFLKLLDNDLFDLHEHQVVFDFFKQYVEKYTNVPKLSNMLEYLDKATRKTPVEDEVYEILEKTIRKMYVPLTAERTQLRETLKEYCQTKKVKNLFLKYAPKLKESKKKGEALETIADIYQEMTRAVRIGEDDAENNRGQPLIASAGVVDLIEGEAHPFFLEGVNKLTTRHGFYKPQLIIFMGGPKSFKTGMLINAAIGYMRQGLKVYYADAENGVSDINMRAKQCILEATFEELKDNRFQKEWKSITKQIKRFGGELIVDYYPANRSSMDDVEINLDYWKEEVGFQPDLIIYDYLDLFKPVKQARRNQEKRNDIQDVYHDAIRLNQKRGTFSFSQSQVKQSAVGKKEIKVTDFAEDFAKAANAHAAFAVCRTPDEEDEGTARIIPVMQRAGKKYKGGKNFCMVRIDEERQYVEEINLSSEMKRLKQIALQDE
jgi:hypothetical protein